MGRLQVSGLPKALEPALPEAQPDDTDDDGRAWIDIPDGHLGSQPPVDIRSRIVKQCATSHPNASCERAHRGGTHSLGPLWGTASRHTEKSRRSKFAYEGDVP